MKVNIRDIGILLIGIGLLMIGIASLLFYKNILYESMYYSEYNKINYYCVNGYIKILAKDSVNNVKILYNGSVVCEFQKLNKGSSKVCDVRRYSNETSTSFIIEYDNNEDIIICLNYEKLERKRIEPI